MLRSLVLLVGLLPSLIFAEVVPIRSGEHETFTRLVFTLPNSETKWELISDIEEPKLRVDAKDLQFDLSQVFNRIPRTRLEGVRQDGSSVTFALNCKCATRAFRFSDRSVVVDILDPETGQEDPVPEERALIQPPERPMLRIDMGTRENLRVDALGIEKHIRTQPQNSTFASELEERLDNAVAQSVVIPAPSADARNLPDAPQEPRADPGAEYAQSNPQNFTLHTSSGLDELMKEALPSLAKWSSRHCAPEHAVSLDHLDMTTPPLEQLGGLRRDLVGEFDKTNPAAAINLASLLTYLTFGAEAREVLRLVPDREETQALMALSHLMEGNPQPAQIYFAHQSECSDWHSFWSTISGATSDLSDAQAHLALRMVGRFPDHLRRELGPVLAQRMIDADRTAEAEQALAFADRVVERPGPRSTLVRAHVETKNDDYPAADTLLEIAISEGSEASPRALIEQVLLYKSRGLPPPEDLISLVTAYSVEHRRTSEGPGLRRAGAVARALAGQFDQAFSSLEEISKRDGAARAQEVKSELAGILVVEAEEFDLVRATILFDLLADLPSELALTMANRLLEAGFQDLAEQSFGNIPQSITPKHRLFRARLALQKDLPNRALAELLGLEGEEIELLRGEALARSTKTEAAARVYREAGMVDEASRLAWLAGDWETLALSSNPAHSQLATWKMAKEAQAKDIDISENAVLARHQALIDDSLAFRDLANSLLAQHEVGNLPAN